MIPLICGDPKKEPASSTRFVLPFAYQLVPIDGYKGALHYGPAEIVDRIWRERYLTEETEDVLFRRAGWFTLRSGTEDWHWKGHMLFHDETAIPVYTSSPFLVLFEHSVHTHQAQWEQAARDMLQTGFLVIELFFPERDDGRPTLDDLRELNELFRYWQQPFEGHEEIKGYRRLLQHWPLSVQDPQQTVGGSSVPAIYFDRWASFLDLPIRDERGHGWRLFPEAWGKEARDWVAGEAKASKGGNRGWIVYADNRTFVWTCALLEKGGETLREIFNEGELRASVFGHWIKLLNVDYWAGSQPREIHQSTEFERRWAEERTYKRWEKESTFYGFNYHSGAMLGPGWKKLPLWKHFGQMYFDQVLLLLYLRVSLFRFSTELNRISRGARDQPKEVGQEKWQKEFQNLRWKFALFTNLYQFPLLSNQQQALEMYSLARQAMDVDELFREIQQEIHSSHEYLAIQQQQKQTRIVTRLTVVATIGLVLALATSFLGMNIISEDLTEKGLLSLLREHGSLLIHTFLSFLVLVGLVVLLSRYLSRIFEQIMGTES